MVKKSVAAIAPQCAFRKAFQGSAGAPLDPQLEPLGDYGGPTETREPLPGSPVVDAIPAEECVYDDDGEPETPPVPVLADQRGVDRPQQSGCDIGAVELMPEPGRALLLGCGIGLLKILGRKRRDSRRDLHLLDRRGYGHDSPRESRRLRGEPELHHRG
jgi:hypothetical protein